MKSISNLLKDNYSLELSVDDGKELKIRMRKGNRGIESWSPISEFNNDEALLKVIYECKRSIDERLKNKKNK